MKMNKTEIEKSVIDCVMQVAREQNIKILDLKPTHSVVDNLGFSSLDVATLTALLENTFKIDPFTLGYASITEIRTIQDMFNLYDHCLNNPDTLNKKTEMSTDSDARMQRRMQKRMQKRAS